MSKGRQRLMHGQPPTRMRPSKCRRKESKRDCRSLTGLGPTGPPRGPGNMAINEGAAAPRRTRGDHLKHHFTLFRTL